MTIATCLWRRLDTPGHDACRLERSAGGWQLEGTAVFRHGARPARLSYRLRCDGIWQAQQGEVQGWLGADTVAFRIARASHGGWTLNDAAVPDLDDCVDLDFGFTPATNLPPLRRLALQPGQAADAPAAWLDAAAGALMLLPQRYERRSEAAYWYEAPSIGYRDLLEIAANGFVRRYPGLWEMET